MDDSRTRGSAAPGAGRGGPLRSGFRLSRKQGWRLALGLAVSAAAVLLLLRRVPLAAIGEHLRSVHLAWVGGMVAFKALLLWGKERRWRWVLKAMAPGPYRATLRAVTAGYFGNLILPLKLGEALRIAILRRHNSGVRAGDVLATIGSERLLDAAVLALLTSAVLPRVVAPPWMVTGVAVLAAALAAVLAVVITAPLHRRWLVRLRKSVWLGRPAELAEAVLAALTRGTAVLRRPGHLAAAVAWTLLIWVFEALVLWCGARALDLPVSYPAAVVVTLLYTFGLLIPSAPVQVGTHQALAVLFLAPFGVGEAAAVSLSLLLQAVSLTVLGLSGGPVVVWEAVRGGGGRGLQTAG